MDHVELPVGADPADPARLGTVLRGRIHRQPAAGTGERHAVAEGLEHRPGGHRSGTAHGGSPEVEERVARLHRVAGHPVEAELTAEAGDPLAVARPVVALEVGGDGVVPCHDVGAEEAQFILTDRRRHDRESARVEAGLREPGKQRQGRRPGERAEDAVGAARRDRLDRVGGHRSGRRDEDHAGELQGPVDQCPADDVGHRPAVEVVAADHEQPPPQAAGGRLQPVEDRQDLLVGDLTAVDDEPRRLVPLVGHAVEQQPLVFLDAGNHRLPRRCRPAAEQRHGAAVEQPAGAVGEQVGTGSGVGGGKLDLPAEQAAAGVDLLDGMDLRVADRCRADRHRTGLGMEQADGHGPHRGRQAAAGDRHRTECPRGGERRGPAVPDGGAAAAAVGLARHRLTPRPCGRTASRTPPARCSPRRGTDCPSPRSGRSSCRGRPTAGHRGADG